jgi:hypothetical protein
MKIGYSTPGISSVSPGTPDIIIQLKQVRPFPFTSPSIYFLIIFLVFEYPIGNLKY